MWITLLLLWAATLAVTWLAFGIMRVARVPAAYRWTAIILGAMLGGIMLVSALLEKWETDSVLLGIPLGLVTFAVVVLLWTYRWLQQPARASTSVDARQRSIFRRLRRPES